MANTFIQIGSVTVGSGGAATMDFTSIPATYTDLLLVCSSRTASVASIDNLVIKPNGATTSQTAIRLQGTGSAAASSTATSFPPVNNAATSTASTFTSTQIYFPNYSGSTNKSLSIDNVQEDNAATAYAQMWAGLWSSTAAISSINLATSSGSNFVQHSTATLYGIKKN
jgi:hypothetical protein